MLPGQGRFRGRAEHAEHAEEFDFTRWTRRSEAWKLDNYNLTMPLSVDLEQIDLRKT